jgi:16S rRNA G966 N2-methylase RsmD
MRRFVTKRASEPSAYLTPVKRENTQIRIELKLQSGYGKTCRHGSLHPSATTTRKRKVNRLYFGDNLKWLRDSREFPDASVDLVYLDPPFNSIGKTLKYAKLIAAEGGDGPQQPEAWQTA